MTNQQPYHSEKNEKPSSEYHGVEIETFDAMFKNQKVTIHDMEAISEFYEKSYIGTKLVDGALELEIEETLLLLERNRIHLFDQNKSELTTQELLARVSKNDTDIWIRFLVYRDFRQRGYIVRKGFGNGIDFRVFPRGASREEDIAKYFVCILNEANPIRLADLDQITHQTIKARKNLLLAVVDRLGEPTYYHLEQFILPLNKDTKKTW